MNDTPTSFGVFYIIKHNQNTHIAPTHDVTPPKRGVQRAHTPTATLYTSNTHQYHPPKPQTHYNQIDSNYIIAVNHSTHINNTPIYYINKNKIKNIHHTNNISTTYYILIKTIKIHQNTYSLVKQYITKYKLTYFNNPAQHITPPINNTPPCRYIQNMIIEDNNHLNIYYYTLMNKENNKTQTLTHYPNQNQNCKEISSVTSLLRGKQHKCLKKASNQLLNTPNNPQTLNKQFDNNDIIVVNCFNNKKIIMQQYINVSAIFKYYCINYNTSINIIDANSLNIKYYILINNGNNNYQIPTHYPPQNQNNKGISNVTSGSHSKWRECLKKATGKLINSPICPLTNRKLIDNNDIIVVNCFLVKIIYISYFSTNKYITNTQIEILSQLHSRCAINSISNMFQQGMKYITYIIPLNKLITLYTNYNTYLNSLHRRSYHFNSPSHCY